MKSSMAVVLGLAAVTTQSVVAAPSPIGKVLSMISDLQSKIVAEGEAAQKQWTEFSAWCEDRSRDLGHEIETGKSDVGSLKATIDEQKSAIASLTTRVEELVASISSNDADLKAATAVREKELKDFSMEEKDLMETVDMIEKATNVIQREMSKGGASMLQLKNAAGLAQALKVMVGASMIGSSDAARLTALVQQKSDDADMDMGAPKAAAYESKSGGIVDVLQDLQEEAESQLSDARKKETAAANNFAMLKQSLEDEMKVSNKDLDEAKKGIAAAGEKKSVAEGALDTSSKDLSADITSKGELHHTCLEKAADFEAETKSRGEELTALATAKKVIAEATDAGASFIQVARSQVASRADLAHLEALRFVRDLARKQQSGVLAQLASSMAQAMHARSGTADPFDKIRSMITGMIAKLQSEATSDSEKKSYCDKEMKETTEKKADKLDSIESMTTKLDQAVAKSAKLKEEVAALEAELAALSKSQAEMDKLRSEQKATFTESESELEKGLDGLKLALQVLREYYAKDSAHSKAEGSAGGIISLIEVCESDFSQNLAELTTEEQVAVSDYEELTQDNKIEKSSKDQDVKYKVKEAKALDKTAAELTSDRDGTQTELDAVVEYLTKLEGECIAKAEPYEEKVKRREAEIAGLKEALQILESETALVQRRASRRALRGSSPRHATLRA